jgi:hypothetical protein
MTDKTISQLPAGAPAQPTDLIPIERGGLNYSLEVSNIFTPPGGSTGQVQFNSGTSFGGSSMTYDPTLQNYTIPAPTNPTDISLTQGTLVVNAPPYDGMGVPSPAITVVGSSNLPLASIALEDTTATIPYAFALEVAGIATQQAVFYDYVNNFFVWNYFYTSGITGGGVDFTNTETFPGPNGSINATGYYLNGVPFTGGGGSPGGSSGQFQINDGSGGFAGIGYSDSNNNVVIGNNNAINFSPSNSFIGGGNNNEINDVDSAVIVGGDSNYINAPSATIVGGTSNTIHADTAFIGGGSNNTNYGQISFIGGGENNAIYNGSYNAIVGGYNNSFNNGGDYGFIGGGQTNTVSQTFASVVGGFSNTAAGQTSAVLGGQNNTASGNGATVLNGQNNTAQGANTIASGSYALAAIDNSTAIGALNTFGTAGAPVLGGSQTATAIFSQQIPAANTTTTFDIDIPAGIVATGDLTYQGTGSTANDSYLSGRTLAVMSYGTSGLGNNTLYQVSQGDGGSWSVSLDQNGSLTGFTVTITTDGTMDTNWTFALVITKTAQSLT